MADIKTPYSGITGTHKGYDDANDMNVYEFTNPIGKKVEYRSVKDPDQMRSFLDVKNYSKDAAANIFSSNVLKPLMPGDQRGVLDRVILPTFRQIPAQIAGLGPELASLLTFIPFPTRFPGLKGTPAGEWWEREGAKDLRKAVKPYGVLEQRKRFEKYARHAEKYLREQGVSDEYNPFTVLGTDMTPEPNDWIESAASMAIEFGVGGAGEVKIATEGAGLTQAIYRAARSLFKTQGDRPPDQETVKSIIDKVRNYYSVRSKEGWRNIRGEVGFGAAAGVSSAAAIEGLNRVDPEAADW